MLKRCEVCGLTDDEVTPDNATAGEVLNEMTEGGKVPTADSDHKQQSGCRRSERTRQSADR